MLAKGMSKEMIIIAALVGANGRPSEMRCEMQITGTATYCALLFAVCKTN